MKILVTLALIGLYLNVAISLPAANDLPKLPKPIEDLLPGIKILKEQHLKNDPGFQAAIKYVKGAEWNKMSADVIATKEWIEFKNFLKDAGFDFDFIIKHFEHCINETKTDDLQVDGVKPSFGSFLDDLKNQYGIALMKAAHEMMEAVNNNEEQKKTLKEITSPKSKELLEKAIAQPALQKIIEKMKEMDINVNYLLDLIYALAGWVSPAYTTPKA